MFVQHVIRFKHQDSYNLLANIQLAKKVVVSFLWCFDMLYFILFLDSTFFPDLINWGKWDMGKLGIVVLW